MSPIFIISYLTLFTSCSYNETRLKNHIIDPYRGCRRIPQEARDRVRNADTSNHQTSTQPPITPSSSLPTHNTTPVTPGPPVKRKRETAILTTTPIQNQPIVAPADSDMLVGIGSTAEPQVTNQVRVAVEFSMTNATVHRATWIAAELLTEFQRELFDVSLIPKQTDDIFNIYIGGKVAWSRVPGQPLPDYEHLRPMVRAQCCHANIKVELTGGLR